jgi:uncharacterized RDD family membrane protein YckC
MNSQLRIETPEGVDFAFTLASPITRALAWALDNAIVIAAGVTLSQISGAFGALNADWAAAIVVVGYFVISTAYWIVMEWLWRGQTIGKRLLRLRVVDAHGLRLTLAQVALRNLLRAVDQLPVCYLLGGAAALLSSRAQRLGDLAANTVVLREPVTSEPDLEQIAPARYNSLAASPHLAARLRNRVPAEAAALAIRSLMQRDTYEPAARLALFADLATYFRNLVPFPADAAEGLTDEQYVRSVVRVLYAARSRAPQATATQATAVAPPTTSPVQ